MDHNNIWSQNKWTEKGARAKQMDGKRAPGQKNEGFIGANRLVSASNCFRRSKRQSKRQSKRR